MDKQTAIKLLGGTPVKAAKAMGYKSAHAIYMWPETLTSDVADRVIGAATRLAKSPVTSFSALTLPATTQAVA